MKLTLVILSVCLLLVAGVFTLQSQFNPTPLSNTKVTFEAKEINMGLILQNQPQQATFRINNIGDAPLLIQQVETSCGCTVPQWTKKPVKPGGSGKITVTYDAKYPGRFHKTITVYANVEDSPVLLSISGEVKLLE